MNSDYISKFYEQYSKEVYLYTFSLCKNSHLAEDIMQEAFVRAILYLDDNHDNIKFWLFRVCRNLYIDYVRKNKIANIMNISNGAVRTLIYRARKHLRSIMEE